MTQSMTQKLIDEIKDIGGSTPQIIHERRRLWVKGTLVDYNIKEPGTIERLLMETDPP